MKLKLTKKRRQEWLVALVIIVIALLGVWWYAEMPAPVPTMPVTLGPAVLPTHTTTTATPAPVPTVNRTDTSVAGVIAGLSGASDFNSYLVSSGLASQLESGGPYTVFVPLNIAFTNLAPGMVSGLSSSAQKRLLEYHIVAGTLLDTDAIMSGTHEAMSKDMLNFSVNLQTGAAYVDSGMVITEYKADNGVVYTINSVLLPPQQ